MTIVKNARIALEDGLQWATSPWDRLPILIELAKELKPHYPDYPYQCARDALSLAEELNDQFWIARSLQALGVLQSRTMQFTEALDNLEKAANIFEGIDDYRMMMQARLLIADIHVMVGELDRGLKQILECRHFFEDLGDPEWIAWSLRSLGNFYKGLSDHTRTIRYFRRAISVATRANLGPQLGGLYHHLSEGCFRLGDFSSAWKYLRKGLILAQENNDIRGIAGAVGTAAACLTALDLNLRAEKYIRLSLTFSRALGHTVHEGMSWAMLGDFYIEKGDFNRALRCFKRGMRVARECEHPRYLGVLHEQIGQLYIDLKDYDRGLSHLKEGFALVEQAGHVFDLHISHRKLANAYQAAGDAVSALHHFKEYTRLKEEHFNSQKIFEANRAEIQRKMRGLARRLKKERVRNDMLTLTIEEKEAELATLTRQLIGNEENQGKESQVVDNTVGTVGSRDVSPPENWDTFARQFHKVHHGFYPDLVRRCPDLTPAEVKVCSLIRVGLSSREIAGILNLSKRTVDNHRARVLGKMNLPVGSSLSKFITAM